MLLSDVGKNLACTNNVAERLIIKALYAVFFKSKIFLGKNFKKVINKKKSVFIVQNSDHQHVK